MLLKQTVPITVFGNRQQQVVFNGKLFYQAAVLERAGNFKAPQRIGLDFAKAPFVNFYHSVFRYKHTGENVH